MDQQTSHLSGPSLAQDFRLSEPVLDRLGARVSSAAPFAVTTSGEPVSLQLVGPTPTRIAVVGAPWVATALCLRAAALGADVVVVTSRPAPWEVLAGQIGGPEPFLHTSPADAPPITTGLDGPLLIAFDHVRGHGEASVSRVPWHTSVHILGKADPMAQTLLDSVDVALIGRPELTDLAATVETLRLPESMGGVFAGLRDGDVMAVHRGQAYPVHINLTHVEYGLLSGS
ncbi:hypothetical protein KEM60_01975 [Austwickia sp. TVS 96-490-7B]|uniref:hypothetical protein n=1 Tax=Austwickia sp. TVS 96-490-7B TaxID=2830843 RepID=UPI001C5A5981|nr:hypothetical protein [Austwickia sp. TVS 96-490-7B]MBW3085766.1 hypothetical protein [Austwickia sp. TVS 96-490-7B]